jgi:hypothetical protein
VQPPTENSVRLLILGADQGANSHWVTSALAALKQIALQRRWRVWSAQGVAETALTDFNAALFLRNPDEMFDHQQRSICDRVSRSGRGIVTFEGMARNDNAGDSTTIGSSLPNAAKLRYIERATTLVNWAPGHPSMFAWPTVRRHTLVWNELDLNIPDGSKILLGAYDPLFSNSGAVPVSWVREGKGARRFHTLMARRPDDFRDDIFRLHLAGAIEWAAGVWSDEVRRVTDGAAAILSEFDGVSENGIWDSQSPSPSFGYAVTREALYMHDSTAVSHMNRHLVRRGVKIDAARPYAIEAQFCMPEEFHPDKHYSISINLNVAGDDGSAENVSTWSLPIHFLDEGKSSQPAHLRPQCRSLTRIMGFCDGAFFMIGELRHNWGRSKTEYRVRVHVNANLSGLPYSKMVSMQVSEGGNTLAAFELDYSTFPYQPDYSKPVRLGLSGHGTSWVLRNLKVYYLDLAENFIGNG